MTDPATKQQIKAGQQLPGFAWLRDDGTTSCGNWLYCGSWTEAGDQTARRDPEDPSGLGVYPNWAWSWPANRRVLYNRASCDVDGKPWDPTRRQVWWNEAHAEVGRQRRAGLQGRLEAQGPHGPVHHESRRRRPHLRAARRVRRRTVPEHYEPIESPIANPLHPKQSNNPVVKKFKTPDDKYGTPQRGLQHRLHDVPADRALSLLDEEQSDERAAGARAVRRDSRGAGRTRWAFAAARKSRSPARAATTSQGDGHEAHQADDDRRQEDLPDRHSHSLGLPRHRRG